MQTDLVRPLTTIAPPNTAVNGTRFFTQVENYKRTERFNVRVRGQVDITVAGAGLRNRGSILAALQRVGFINNGKDIFAVDARLSAFMANMMAPSALPATRLAGVGVQAATIIEETCPIILSAYRTGNLGETRYVEANKQALLQAFIESRISSIAVLSGGAPTGTITNLTVSLEQVCDELLNTPPFLQTFVRTIETNVVAANPALKIDLRGSRFVRGIAIQQDSDAGEVSDIINALVLRGDKRSVYGDRPITFADLRLAQAIEYGGEIPPGYLWIDFCREGRLSTMWAPYQDTNFRLELDVAVSASAGGLVRVAVVEYERTDSTTTDPPFSI